MAVIRSPTGRQYANRLLTADSTGLTLVAIAVAGGVLGLTIGIGSLVLSGQDSPLIARKLAFGFLTGALPIGLSGGSILLWPEIRRRYLAGGVVSSVGAVILFEITYPGAWRTQYETVGTFIYASGLAVLLGLAVWALRHWVGVDRVAPEDSAEADEATGETGTDDDDESSKAVSGTGATTDERETDGDPDDGDDGSETGTAEADEETSPLGTDGPADVTTGTGRAGNRDQPRSPGARLNELTAEVQGLSSQLEALDPDQFQSAGSDLEVGVDEVVDRTERVISDVEDLRSGVRRLETELGTLESELDQIGSDRAGSVEQVLFELPTVPDAEERPSRRSTRIAASQTERRPTDQTREQAGGRRAESARPSARQSPKARLQQPRPDSKTRVSSHAGKAAVAASSRDRDRGSIDTVDEEYWIKVILTVISAGIIILMALLGGAL